MKAERSLRYLDEYRIAIAIIINDAIERKTSHNEVVKEYVRSVVSRLREDGVPDWVKGQTFAYFDGQIDRMQADHVEWRVRLDGKLVLSKDVPAGMWHTVGRGAFVWKGTDKIFSDALSHETEERPTTVKENKR